MEKLILIIDDDKMYLSFMKVHFDNMGYRVQIFQKGMSPWVSWECVILPHYS